MAARAIEFPRPKRLALPTAAPAALATLPAWLTWRYEQHPGEVKPRKVPYYAAGGRRRGVQGAPADRAALVPFTEALAAAREQGRDGVGIAMLADWDILGVDVDNCVQPDGSLPADLEQSLTGTYAETSPSGRGLRAFVRATPVTDAWGNGKALAGDGYKVELFRSKGFLTFTGQVLPWTVVCDSVDTVGPPSAGLLALLGQRFADRRTAVLDPDPTARADNAATGLESPPLGLSEAQLREALDVLDADMGHDDWLRMGMALHHETSGAGLALWDEWSSRGTKYPGADEIAYRWASFGRQPGRPATAHALVRMANAHGARIDLAGLGLADFEALIDGREAAAEAPVVELAAVGPPLADDQSAAPKPPRFTVVEPVPFTQRRAPRWLVKGLVPEAGLMVWYGASGSGKTFTVLDVVLAIAQGQPWRGLKTRQRDVVYVAAEGAGGFRNRLVAYAQQHALDLATLGHAFGVIPDAPNLLEHADALDLCKSLLAYGRPKVVVLDTTAQVMPGGNENASEDMGKLLLHCRRIHQVTGALVILVHHAGKDASRGARGWSGLKAAADAEVEIERTPLGRAIRVTKQKDGEDGLEYGFTLDVVQIGADEDGDPITSCVVLPADPPARHQVDQATRRLGKWERWIAQAIDEMAQAQTTGLERSAIVDTALALLERAEGPATGTDTERLRRQNLKRALGYRLSAEDSPYVDEGDGTISVG